MRPLPLLILSGILFLSTTTLAQMKSLNANDTLAAANLSPKEFREIIADLKKGAFDIPQSWTTELRLRRINLGKRSGIVIQGTSLLCGGTGNCQTWVFRQANGKWTSMFAADQVPIAEGFDLGPTATRGIADLTISTNLSADGSKRVKYKFDGKRYRPKFE